MGWLSFNQAVYYQSAKLMHQVMTTETPKYLSEVTNINHPYPTRSQDNNNKLKPNWHKLISQRSLTYRGVDQYQQMPVHIRNEKTS